MSEDKVLFGQRVAGEAGVVQRLTVRLAVGELTEPPTAGRSVLPGVLDHELKVRSGPRHERFDRERLVVFLGRGLIPGEPSNDCPVRKRDLLLSKGADRHIVAEFGAHVVKRGPNAAHGDQCPVAVSRRDFDAVDWRGRYTGLSR